ncbi:hypothetical protein IE4771_CH01135 [Rhizobium etli bv. mimosae str. IE4771]|uniref:Uncharacterized protein n=1 Tax=Rhizobium etli bv. mimosae str. IE4771 TaxID=1432050 RepID=A0A060I458_RHIET|nr:hypothetical protein IE4771_CH01135 [Rhizobium sp. IE4771]
MAQLVNEIRVYLTSRIGKFGLRHHRQASRPPLPQWPRGRWLKIKCVQSESFMIAGHAGHGPRAQIIEIDEQWHTGMDVYLMNVLSSGGS